MHKYQKYKLFICNIKVIVAELPRMGCYHSIIYKMRTVPILYYSSKRCPVFRSQIGSLRCAIGGVFVIDPNIVRERLLNFYATKLCSNYANMSFLNNVFFQPMFCVKFVAISHA